MNIRLDLEYDGSRFHGFGIQPELLTVQGEIERILGQLYQREIRIIGAGRTDAGVHARGQVANFYLDRPVDCPELLYKLNRMSPPGLAFNAVREVTDAFNARTPTRAIIFLHPQVPVSDSPDLIHNCLRPTGKPML